MPHDPIKAYCESVCAMIRCKPYHPRVTAELSTHMTDHADRLIAKGADEAQAKKDAANAMGDPYAIGKNLDALHSPWYPRLSRVFTVLAALLFLVSLVVYLNIDLIDQRFVPFADPAELVREEFPGAVLYEGSAVGGGALGAYTFFDGAALLYEDTAEVSDSPRYYLSLALPSNTPYFWLDNPNLTYVPRLLDDTDDHATSYHWSPTRGVFRRFNHFQVEVAPPFQGSYTFALGEDGEVSYTISLKEVASP